MYKTASRYIQHHVENLNYNLNNKSHQRISRQIRDAYTLKNIVKGRLVDEVKGGYIIKILKCRTFCPYSEMYPNKLSAQILNNLENELHEYIIIDIESNSAVVSRKKAVQIQTWKEIHKSLLDGIFIPGIVKNVTEYGAFIDLGGVDGLLHFNNMNKNRSNGRKFSANINQVVNVRVINIEQNSKRIALSMSI